MAVADLDGDGHLDIAACPEKLECFAYLNDTGTFRSGSQFPAFGLSRRTVDRGRIPW
jgi:hypothetical protein